MYNYQKKIVVIGDSHSLIWGGNLALETLTSRRYNPKSKFENVDVFWLGPALAYNLMGENNKLGKWGLKIFEKIGLLLETNKIGYVILSFGEIDIRCHVVKQSLFLNSSIEKVVEDLTNRLLKFAEIFYSKFGLPLLIWDPIATVTQFYEMHPTFGSEKERNYATELFSNFLIQKTAILRKKNSKIYSFGIFNQTTTNYVSHNEFKEDGLHLNLKGLKLGIEALECLSKNENLDCYKYFQRSFKQLSEFKEFDITESVKFKLSSKYNSKNSLTNDYGRGFCFHTQNEKNPTVFIDIGFSSPLTKIILYNRKDGWRERAKLIEVWVGNSVKDMIKVSSNDWENIDKPFEIIFDNKKNNFFRYVMLRLNDNQYFHLGSVHIFSLQNVI